MISIIVSTYKPNTFSVFLENVKLNIGVEYEIISIENKGRYGLCEAYNLGIKQAKYPYICFCHDDLIINRMNWGKYVIDEFNKYSDLGLLGVAGSTYKTYSPSGWFFPYDIDYCRTDMWQAKNGDSNNKKYSLFNKPDSIDIKIEEVVVLDGCWLFTKKEVTDKYKFDEKLLKGYHCYDLDYSLQVGTEYKLGVIYDLDIIHLSEGNFDRSWIIETFKLQEKWKRKLPFYSRSITPTVEQKKNNEFKAFQFIMAKVLDYNAPLTPLLKVLYSSKLIFLMGLKNWVKVSKWTWIGILRNMYNKR